MGCKLYLNKAYKKRQETERCRDAKIQGNFGF